MFRPTSKPARAAAKAAAVSLSAVTACAATPAALASAAPDGARPAVQQRAPGDQEAARGTDGPHDVVFVQTSAEDGNTIVAYPGPPRAPSSRRAATPPAATAAG